MGSHHHKITITDLAKQLGMAKGTVSRALNDYPGVAEATRKRVKETADRLGYRPSSPARNLKRKRVETIGFVVSMKDHRVSDPFLAEFLDSLSRTLEAMNYDLLLATASTPRDTVKVYQRLLAERKVDGVVVNRTEVDDIRVKYLQSHDVPFVAHGRTANPEGYAWWDMDNEQAFVDATSLVVSKGHRRIGLLGGRSHLNFARLRREGYRRGLAEADIVHDPLLEVEVDLAENAGFEATLHLLKTANPPTVLLAVTDSVAIGGIVAIHSLGLVVGEDVSVVGYDGISVGAFIDPPLTTFSQPVRKSGAQVALMLMEILDGAEPEEFQHLERAELIERRSAGPPALTPAALANKISLPQKSSRRTSHV